MAESDLKQVAIARWKYRDIQLGKFQRFAETVSVPVLATDSAGEKSVRIIVLDGPRPADWSVDSKFAIKIGAGEVDIGGAAYWHGYWWVPVRTSNGSVREQWEMWRVSANGEHRIEVAHVLLPSLAGSGATKEFLHSIEPSDPTSVLPSISTLLLGF